MEYLHLTVYNRMSDEYDVVWRGGDGSVRMIGNENEILGQRSATEFLVYLSVMDQ